MSQENVELVREVYAAWARGDFSAGADLRAAGFEYQQLSSSVEPGLRRGAEVGHALRGIFDVYEDVRIEAEEFIDAGERVVVVARVHGTARESGLKLEQRFGFVWTLSDLALIRTEVYRDRREALEAAGLAE